MSLNSLGGITKPLTSWASAVSSPPPATATLPATFIVASSASANSIGVATISVPTSSSAAAAAVVVTSTPSLTSLATPAVIVGSSSINDDSSARGRRRGEGYENEEKIVIYLNSRFSA